MKSEPEAHVKYPGDMVHGFEHGEGEADEIEMLVIVLRDLLVVASEPKIDRARLKEGLRACLELAEILDEEVV